MVGVFSVKELARIVIIVLILQICVPPFLEMGSLMVDFMKTKTYFDSMVNSCVEDSVSNEWIKSGVAVLDKNKLKNEIINNFLNFVVDNNINQFVTDPNVEISLLKSISYGDSYVLEVNDNDIESSVEEGSNQFSMVSLTNNFNTVHISVEVYYRIRSNILKKVLDTISSVDDSVNNMFSNQGIKFVFSKDVQVNIDY